MKKLFTILLSVTIVFAFSFTVSFAGSAKDYDPYATIEKAYSLATKGMNGANVKDPHTGLEYDCVKFVRHCVEAGGIPVDKKKGKIGYTPGEYINYLVDNGYAIKTKLETYPYYANYYGVFDGGANEGKIHTGDILMYKCTKASCNKSSKRVFHVEIFNDVSGGFWTTYSANPWKNGSKKAVVFGHSADFSKNTSAEAIKNVELYSVQILCDANGFTGPEEEVAEVNAKLVKYNSLSVSWEPTSDADGYRVYAKAGSSGAYKLKKTLTGTSATLTGLTAGKATYVKVVPYKNLAGSKIEGKGTVSKSVYTLKKLATPKVAKSGSKNVKVTWKNISGETGYEISQAAKGKTKVVKTVESAKATNAVIAKGKAKQYYKVRAYVVVDEVTIYGPWSSAVRY